MKWTLPVMSPRVRGLHGIAVYGRFGQVHGIRTRICPTSTLEYSSLKNSSGLSETYLGQQRSKA